MLCWSQQMDLMYGWQRSHGAEAKHLCKPMVSVQAGDGLFRLCQRDDAPTAERFFSKKKSENIITKHHTSQIVN